MKDEAADKHDLRWGRDPVQRVTIKGLRLFSKKGGEVYLQVFVGRRWVCVGIVQDMAVKAPYNATSTARWIKHCIKGRRT